jgi:tetratricopeptide (TPR) repeat protein
MAIDQDTAHLGSSIGALNPGDSHGAGPSERPPQDELNLFLQLELSHSLGSYGLTVQGMRALLERMTARGAAEPWGALFPRDALARMCDYNESLRSSLHMPAELRKDRSALREVAAPSQHPDPGESLGGEDMRYQWVLDFYASAVVSLDFATGGRKGTATEEQLQFGENLKVVHDPQRRGRSALSENALARGRISRNTHRLERAMHLFGLEPHADRAREILADHLGEGNDGAPLHTQVIGALVEAHIRMHRAEHLISHSFGDKIRRRSEIDQAVDHELKRSLALNTFAYVASRTAPWIFAARKEERDYVVDNFKDCCETLTPTYCTWLANQVGLLALQRRAFTWLVLGDCDKAHNDFQKVKRLVRGLERQLEERILRPAGAHIFLRGISAFADHHSGRLYRVQHAHSAALRHFDRAALQLTRMEKDTDVIDLLRNSRWRIHLLVGQAKASYELGLIKQTLVCFIRAWRAFLELADTESSARANFRVIDGVIEWLEEVAPDAEVNKVDLTNRLAPLVRQVQVVRGPTHLRVLAADILMRLAHVLFMLKLPRVQGEQVARNSDGEPVEDHELAYRCLLQAARLDRSQTLIAADLLKAKKWKRHNEDSKDKVPTVATLDVQWPGGGGQFEEAARIVEYVLQSWLQLAEPQENASPEEKIARDLLTSFLVHTDSTNVKLAQVYRYLMQDSARALEDNISTEDIDRQLRAALCSEPGCIDGNAELPGHDPTPKTPHLELVCLRRYSSFFPFVPRPMAFRVVGGGYFVRISTAAATAWRMFT